MELFVGVQGSQDFYTVDAGAKIVVHDRNVTPLVKFDGSTASVGEATLFSLAHTSYAKLGSVYLWIFKLFLLLYLLKVIF